MKYISTRGAAPELSFEEAMMTGLARDGGLYVPETVPTLSVDEIAAMAGQSYEEIAFTVMRPFIGDTFSDDEFRDLIEAAYADFNHSARAPLKQLDSAKQMGLPIEDLVIATNQNDILHRTLETGAQVKEGVTPSISPSMDIQVSSNFERALFDAYGRDGAVVSEQMDQLKNDGAQHPPLPPHMADLFERDERVTRVPNDLAALQNLIKERRSK